MPSRVLLHCSFKRIFSALKSCKIQKSDIIVGISKFHWKIDVDVLMYIYTSTEIEEFRFGKMCISTENLIQGAEPHTSWERPKNVIFVKTKLSYEFFPTMKSDFYDRMRTGASWRQALYVVRTTSKRDFCENKIEWSIFSHYEIRFSRSDENWRQALYVVRTA